MVSDTNIYDPTTSTWTRMANMSYTRWYPTTTTMPDGRVLAISGYINPSQMADVPEVYNPANNTWTALTGATLNVPMYSFMYVLPTGTATPTPSATATRTATATSTPSATPTNTATATATDDATPTDTATATETGTATSTATSTGTATSTATSTSTPTATPSGTPTSTATSTSTPSATPSTTPSSKATASATPGGANSALDFDGANDVARGSQIAGSTGTQTIEAWVRPDTNNQNALVDFHSDNTTGWSLELNNGQATFWVANPNGTWRFARNTNVTLTANTWYHIAATYSAGTARVYVNGNQGASASVGTISQEPMLRLGGISGFPFFNGQIDEVRISDIVRYSSAFTRPTAPFVTDSNTLALYHLNESSGQIASDSSGRGYTLTLGSGASADSADPAWLTSSAPIN